ncbi:hypothetical protein MMA231_03988 (plasmid) [Asticcacaulis sp. MM231]|uniref:YqcI/YcgG family protein n=1 Tax=Asticcacaulis sp. MM231 TaxID=3157666 RepID=UPI0032D5A086
MAEQVSRVGAARPVKKGAHADTDSYGSLSPDGDRSVWFNEDIEGPHFQWLPPWAKLAVGKFHDRIRDRNFPCFFAPAADRQGTIVYSFLKGTNTAADIEALLAQIGDYLHGLRSLPAQKADMTVLVAFVMPPARRQTLGQYARQSFDLLSELHALDPVDWPLHIPKDQNDPKWSFALFGEALFINISTPANVVRRSRNLGEGLVLIISPREVFDRIAPAGEAGDRVRGNIRRRSAGYDGLETAPWTTNYGMGGPGGERKQYLLPDDNENSIDLTITYRDSKPGPGKCPFGHG